MYSWSESLACCREAACRLPLHEGCGQDWAWSCHSQGDRRGKGKLLLIFILRKSVETYLKWFFAFFLVESNFTSVKWLKWCLNIVLQHAAFWMRILISFFPDFLYLHLRFIWTFRDGTEIQFCHHFASSVLSFKKVPVIGKSVPQHLSNDHLGNLPYRLINEQFYVP